MCVCSPSPSPHCLFVLLAKVLGDEKETRRECKRDGEWENEKYITYPDMF